MFAYIFATSYGKGSGQTCGSAGPPSPVPPHVLQPSGPLDLIVKRQSGHGDRENHDMPQFSHVSIVSSLTPAPPPSNTPDNEQTEK
jgi:hypothetical protein